MRKSKRIVLVVIVSLLLLVISLGGVLTSTQVGLKFIASNLEALLRNKLVIGDVEGRLLGHWSAKDIAYTSSELSVSLDELVCSINSLSLLSGELHFQKLAGENIQVFLEEQRQKKKADAQGGAFIMPLGIVVDELTVSGLQVLQGQQTYVLQSLNLRGQLLDNRLDVSSLQVSSPVFTGKLSGSLSLTGSKVWNAQVRVENFSPFHLNKEWPGVYRGELVSTGSMQGKDPEALLEIINVQGEVKGHSLILHGKTQIKDAIFTLSDVTLSKEDTTFQLGGSIGKKLDLQFNLLAPELNQLTPEAKGMLEINGVVEGTPEQPQIIASLLGKSLVVQEKVIDGFSGQLSTHLSEGGMVDGKISIYELIFEGTTFYDNSLAFSGSLESHQVNLELGPELGELSFGLSGSYQLESWQGVVEKCELSFPMEKLWTMEKTTPLSLSASSVVLQPFCLQHAEEKLCVAGEWNGEGGSWLGKLDFDNIDPSAFMPEWAGTVSGKVKGKGDQSGKTDTHEIEIVSLTGTIANEPVQGAGKILLEDGNVVIDELNLELADSHLLLTGVVNSDLDLSFQVDSQDLSKVFQEAGGKLDIEGSIKGSREFPLLQTVFRLDRGKFTTLTAEKLFGTIHLDLKKNGVISSSVQGVNIQTESVLIRTSKIAVDGTSDDHRVEIGVISDKGDLQIHGAGRILNKVWQGNIQQLDFDAKDFGKWQLAGKADLLIGSNSAHVRTFCLEGEVGETCLDAEWQRNLPWSLRVDIPRLSLDQFAETFLPSFPLKGEMKAFFEADGSRGFPENARGEISLPVASVTLVPENEKSYTVYLQENHVQLSLENQELFSTVSIGSKEGSLMKSDLTIAGVDESSLTSIGSLPVHGKMDVLIKDLSFLSGLTDFFVKASGGLQGEVLFDGPLDGPKIVGDLVLKDGELLVPSLGIVFTNLTASLDAQGEKVELLYGSRKEDGFLKGNGTLDLGEEGGWGVKGNLTGKTFQLISLPEYEIIAEPDLNYTVNSKGGIVEGRIVIPTARIAPTGGSGGVSSSSDVVFVDETQEESKKKWELATDIEIELGDDVRLDTHGLKSLLTGKLAIKSLPRRAPTGNGDLVLEEGTYSFYGRSFDIERGRIFFSGGPIDNPGIDVRAQKTIGETVVGVDISGTVADFELNLFSMPAMEERDILAYLILGRSGAAKNEDEGDMLGVAAATLGLAGVNKVTSGVGKRLGVDEIHLEGGSGSEDMSIVVGKNITEDLFIGYDHDFFNSTGEFRVRYKLGKGFSIETRSSAASTSGDLLFSIEK